MFLRIHCASLSLYSHLFCHSRQLLCPSYCYVMFFSRRMEGNCWWGAALWSRTSHLTRFWSRPTSPSAGCACHSLTDRYKVTTVFSAVLNSPLSLSCPSTMPGRPTRRTCLFCVLIELQHKLVLCTPRVIENM